MPVSHIHIQEPFLLQVVHLVQSLNYYQNMPVMCLFCAAMKTWWCKMAASIEGDLLLFVNKDSFFKAKHFINPADYTLIKMNFKRYYISVESIVLIPLISTQCVFNSVTFLLFTHTPVANVILLQSWHVQETKILMLWFTHTADWIINLQWVTQCGKGVRTACQHSSVFVIIHRGKKWKKMVTLSWITDIQCLSDSSNHHAV